MSHFSVLILGDEPEQQLQPFAHLSAVAEPWADDDRAVFTREIPRSDFAAAARKFLAQAEADGQGDLQHIRGLVEAEAYATLFAEYFGGDLGPEGDWGSYENPQAKWDWFLFGGRWQGQLRLLPERTGASGECSWTNDDRPEDPNAFDQARAGDIDWAATREHLTPFAVLKDGEWHEQGALGWFGTVSDPKEETVWAAEVDALLKDLPPETLVSVYDCHI